MILPLSASHVGMPGMQARQELHNVNTLNWVLGLLAVLVLGVVYCLWHTACRMWRCLACAVAGGHSADPYALLRARPSAARS